MEVFITDRLMNLLMMGITFSIFEMALVQKIKMLPFFNKDYKIWFLNFILSFAMGIPFVTYFFSLSLTDAIWVSLFGFIGAPSIYKTLKKQTLINYKPQSAKKNETVTILKENEIKR